MIKNQIIFGLTLWLGLSSIQAQPTNWAFIDHGDHQPYVPRDMVYSENLGVTVYCSYFFDENDDPYFAGYNGVEWISLSDTISGTINTVVDYGSGILVCGNNAFVGTQQMDAIAYFDGNEWTYPWSFNDDISKLVWANDTLYAIGWFTEIDGQEAYRIARLVDGDWEGLIEPDLFLQNSPLYDLTYYDGDIYVGGGFETIDGVKKFARLTDVGLDEVAGGLPGANTGIREMKVFNGELYLGGIIPMFQGNVGNHIVRYNGDSILPVGEPLGNEPYVSEIGGNVQSFERFGGFLYVIGNFFYVGDEPMYAIARWDGEEWCGLYGNDFLQGDPPYNNVVWESGTFQGKLMIRVYYLDEAGDNMPIWLYEGWRRCK